MSGHHDHAPQSTKNIRIAFFLNLFFAIVELVGGWYTNSIAIISDALHDLGDSLSLGVAWYFQKLAGRSSDPDFSYGYKRFSVLGAIINALVLTGGSILIIVEAVPRLFAPEMPDATGMLYLSLGGIIVNGLAAFRLSKGHSLNEKAVYLHLLEDILGWVATLIVAIVLQIRAIPVLDPILSLLISGYIFYNVIKNLRQSAKIILQGTPAEIKPENIENEIRNVDGIKDVHDCHIWSLDGNYHIMSLHVVVEKNYQLSEVALIKQKVKEITKIHGIPHTTLEFELAQEDCDAC
jgi:cobalt-zinc-cadmium efflux system protein